MGNIERSGWDYEGRVVEAMAAQDQIIARFCKALGEPIPEDAITRAEQLQGAVEAMEVARSALKRRMLGDDTLDRPYDEDMADAIRRLDTALGGR